MVFVKIAFESAGQNCSLALIVLPTSALKLTNIRWIMKSKWLDFDSISVTRSMIVVLSSSHRTKLAHRIDCKTVFFLKNSFPGTESSRAANTFPVDFVDTHCTRTSRATPRRYVITYYLFVDFDFIYRLFDYLRGEPRERTLSVRWSAAAAVASTTRIRF